MNNRLVIEACQQREWTVTNKPTPAHLSEVKGTGIPWPVRLRNAGQGIAFAALVLLLWRVPFLAGLKPFVWGYFFAWSVIDPWVARWALFLLIPSWCCSTDAMSGAMVSRLASLTLLNLFVLVFGRIRFRGMLVGAGVVAVATVILGLIYHSDGLGLALAVGEIASGVLLGRLLLPALNQWNNHEDQFAFRELEVHLSVMVLLCVVFMGMNGLGWGFVNLNVLFGLFLIMYAADRHGFSTAVAVGTALSLTQLVIPNTGYYPLLYAAAGLFAGLGKEFSRWGVSLGALFSLILFPLLRGALWSIELLYVLPPAIMAGLYGFFAPKLWKEEVTQNPQNPNQLGVNDQEERLRAVLTERLKGLAAAFDHLSQSFSMPEPKKETKPLNIYGLIEEICQRTCKQCIGYEKCWGENFYGTYREVFNLISLAEMTGQVSPQHITGRLATDCFQQFRLLSTINHRVEQQKSENFWNRRLEENRSFLSGQLQGVANIMSNLAQEVRLNVDFRSELEEELKLTFNRWGMNIHELFVVQTGQDRIEIRIKKRSCGGCHECRVVAAPMVTRLMGQKFVVCKRECRHDEENCYFMLCPARKFGIRSAVCKKPRQGNLTSGDTHSLMELQEGYFVSILSDGMGVGTKAAQESGTTVSVLEELLRAGLNKEFAVQMVNSVLLLRNQEETFATVDVGLINLYTAQGEFIKIGAAPTYVKQGKEVTVIRSTSLPVGILNNVDAETSKLQLSPGDMVIMVTDGILESRVTAGQQEDWVCQALTKVNVTGPEALGQYLLENATGGKGHGAQDDMTVVVLQVEALEDV